MESDLFFAMTEPCALDAAWDKVRSNAGCAGGDGETIESFRLRAPRRLLLLSTALRNGSYRPRPLRVVEIPKRSGGKRPLAIPAVEDRIAQTACAQILTPLLDPIFSEASFAYRPGRSVEQAVRAVSRWRDNGYVHVVEADIVRCFERIPLDRLLERLMAALQSRTGAERLVDLVALWLEHASTILQTPGVGLAQGSPLSPLLANLHLDHLDDALEQRRVKLVRFADDFVLLCKTEGLAHAMLEETAAVLEAQGLELRADRARVIDFDRGFEFLGHMFVRSMVLKKVVDPEEDAVDWMRDLAGRDRTEAAEEDKRSARVAEEVARGYDRGQRVLYLSGAGRRLSLRNFSFSVVGADEEGGRELVAIAHDRVDRIEIGPLADIDVEAIRHALATDTALDFVNGAGGPLGWLTAPSFDRSGLHLAQARIALDPALATDLARRIVEGRIRNQRAQLRLLNRRAKDSDVVVAAKTLGRVLRKLPQAGKVTSLRGHEGEAGAVYWPALGRLTGLHKGLRRSRPAVDPLNATINYLTAVLARDVRSAAVRRGLHPGFGVLHCAADGHEAGIWDLMEGFRAPLSEGLAVALFNQGRLKDEMFVSTDKEVRIMPEARTAIIRGYESATARLTTSRHSGRRRTWRALIEEEAGAYAAHCRDPAGRGFAPHLLDH